MERILVEVDYSNRNEWNSYILGRNDTTFTDTWEWRQVIEKAYGLKNYWFMVKINNKIEGCVALTLTNHTIFGKYLATAPFGNYGGIYYTTNDALQKICEKVSLLHNHLNLHYTLLRKINNELTMPEGWISENIYATYQLKIPNDLQDYYKTVLKKKVRWFVKNAKKNGFAISFGRNELVNDFIIVMRRSMKELGSPYHSSVYIRTLIEIFGDSAQLGVVYSNEGIPCAASLLIAHDNNAVLLHANILNKYRHFNVGEYLYWSIIEYCANNNFHTLDMGRSLKGSGNEHFKMKWRPEVKPLSYWYYLPGEKRLPSLNQANPKYRMAISLWRRMPLWSHKIIGPKLISGIL